MAEATVTIPRALAERLNKHMATLASIARSEDWLNKADIQEAWAQIHKARSQS